MILPSNQGRRFCKLFYGLLDNLAPELGFRSTPRYPCDELSDDDICDLVMHIWGEPGHRDLIDDFVARNPLRFNRTDLRQIEAWKDGLFGCFAIVRDGRDTVFLYGGHAFVVRGIREEVDDVVGSPLPMAGYSVLLPCDVLITYGACVLQEPVESILVQDSLLQQVQAATQAGRRVSTARALRTTAEDARLAEQEHPTVTVAAPLPLDPFALDDRPIPNQHCGALADLTGQEREKAIKDHDQRMRDGLSGEERALRYDTLRDDIDAECVDGGFAWTLEQAVGALDEDDLYALAKRVGLDSRKAGQELAQECVRVVSTNSEALLYPAILMGPEAVRDVQRVDDYDGVLRMSDMGPALLDVPHAYPPATLLYHRDDEFVCLMPRDAQGLLRHVNWNDSVARAQRIDLAVRYVEVAVELRGVTLKDQIFEEALEYARGVTAKELDDAMAQRGHMMTLALFPIEQGGTTYLVDEEVVFGEYLERAIQDMRDIRVHNLLADRTQTERDFQVIDDVLSAQQGKPPCIPNKAQLELGVVEATLRISQVQALVAFFDKNVPDGYDDYRFADDAMAAIVRCCRMMGDLEGIFSTLRAYGFVPTQEQLDKMLDPLKDFLDAIPMWTHNGWTPQNVPLPKGSEQKEHAVEMREISITVRK
ncbi:MAG: hypothetical protein Q4A01_03050 [Coriobacteriales bacterium]|nr:hypothetical protein [Coriobacteriales bacterium]